MRGPGAVAQRLQRLQLGQRALDGLGTQARAATAQIGQRPQHAGQAFGAAQAAAAAPHQVALAQRQQRLQRRCGDLDRQARTAAAHPGLHGFVLILPCNAFAEGEAERQIGERLRDGGFVVNPQVSIMLMQIRSSQVAVLGQVGRPGRYPLETTDTKLIDMLAIAGGIAPTGADVVVLNGYRAGKPISVEIDIPRLLLNAQFEQNIALQGGDILYVHRAPVFYIYGEIQRPGSYRLDRDMTVRHALALAGGITLRGTERGLRLHRRDENGKMIHLVEPNHDTLVRHDDVIFIRASLF